MSRRGGWVPIIEAESVDDGATFTSTDGMPAGDFHALLSVPCPAGRYARGGIGGAALTACSYCGHVSPSTAGERHDDPMLVPVIAQAVVIGDRQAVMWRRAFAADFAAVPSDDTGDGRDVRSLPEWAALVAAVSEDGGTVDMYRRAVTGRAAALVRAARTEADRG